MCVCVCVCGSDGCVRALAFAQSSVDTFSFFFKRNMASSDVREILELDGDSQEFMTKDALFNDGQKKVT